MDLHKYAVKEPEPEASQAGSATASRAGSVDLGRRASIDISRTGSRAASVELSRAGSAAATVAAVAAAADEAAARQAQVETTAERRVTTPVETAAGAVEPGSNPVAAIGAPSAGVTQVSTSPDTAAALQQAGLRSQDPLLGSTPPLLAPPPVAAVAGSEGRSSSDHDSAASTGLAKVSKKGDEGKEVEVAAGGKFAPVLKPGEQGQGKDGKLVKVRGSGDTGQWQCHNATMPHRHTGTPGQTLGQRCSLLEGLEPHWRRQCTLWHLVRSPAHDASVTAAALLLLWVG